MKLFRISDKQFNEVPICEGRAFVVSDPTNGSIIFHLCDGEDTPHHWRIEISRTEYNEMFLEFTEACLSQGKTQ